MTEKKEHLVSYTQAELDSLPDDSDWAAVNSMTNEEIELNAQEDIMENLAGFNTVAIRIPYDKFLQTVPLEQDAYNWLQIKGYHPQQFVNNLIHEQMRQNP